MEIDEKVDIYRLERIFGYAGICITGVSKTISDRYAGEANIKFECECSSTRLTNWITQINHHEILSGKYQELVDLMDKYPELRNVIDRYRVKEALSKNDKKND